MNIILLSIIISAVTSSVITARFRREIFDCVEKICDLNVASIKAVEELTLSKIEEVADTINRSTGK